jgi:hypothetical protein
VLAGGPSRSSVGLTPEDRSDPYESFSRPEMMGEEGSSDEATQAHAGAGDP